MRIISYKKNNNIHIGILISDTTFINVDKHIKCKDCLSLIQNFNKYRSEIEALIRSENNLEKLDKVRILSPLTNPPSLRDAYAFRQHVETSRKNRGLEMIEEFNHFPVYYYSNHNTIVGPGDVDIDKALSQKLDYELEIAIIIGKKGINIPSSKADEYIFGFTIMNDLSSRQIQLDEMKLNLGPAKGKDFATVLGPSILTIDEISDKIIPTRNGNKYDIELKGFLNNTLISQDNLKNMTWTFAQIIERISVGTYIYPGDVIGSGTCATGCLYELNSSSKAKPYWLKDGDSIKITADTIGSLENTINIV